MYAKFLETVREAFCYTSDSGRASQTLDAVANVAAQSIDLGQAFGLIQQLNAKGVDLSDNVFEGATCLEVLRAIVAAGVAKLLRSTDPQLAGMELAYLDQTAPSAI